jgi:hypothetical protein
MSQVAAAPVSGAPSVPTIPLVQLTPWALFLGLFGLLVLFFIGADQGAVSLVSGSAIHEWVHDGRHLLGYPCH